jgi:hypothetical protein
MKADTKKLLKRLVKEVAALNDTLEKEAQELGEAIEEEVEAFDNRSDAWKESDAGAEAQSKLETLQAVVDSFDSVTREIETLYGYLQELMGDKA